jgi:thiol:disulfide interchange protein DsbC
MTTSKKIALFILFFPSFFLMADEASLKKMIEASYPKYKVESIKKTSYSGLYEVFMGGQIIYTDEKFSFLIAEGHIVDPKTKKDLTGERLEDLTKVDFRPCLLIPLLKQLKAMVRES